MSDADAREALKRHAAERAVAAVRDGMVVGLGTGSTAEHAVRLLAERVRVGLQIRGVPTSLRTERLARDLGIPLLDLQEAERIDLTIDGADEIDRDTLAAIKGRGGALVREKLVALASDRLVLIADDSKLVARLGERCPVPVEVVPFGWRVPARALATLGGRVALRALPGGAPFVSDNGGYVLDVDFGAIADPAALAARIKAITGVVDHGLFVGLAAEAIVAAPGGVAVYMAPTGRG